jgi:hypothetical protein
MPPRRRLKLKLDRIDDLRYGPGKRTEMYLPAARPPLITGRRAEPMPDTKAAGDSSRLETYDDQLPTPPEHDGEDGEQGDQPEPEEVSDAVLDH